MPGIYRDLVQVWNDPVNAERLVPELALVHYIIDSSGSRSLPVIECQIRGVHVPMFPVRSRHLVPGGICFGNHLHGQGVLISREDLIVPTGTITEVIWARTDASFSSIVSSVSSGAGV